jgi:hypothetical protein
MAIHSKLGNTVLMITHDVDEAVLLSDRIVMMTNGPSAQIGEVLEVPLARPRKRLSLAADPTYLKCPSAQCSNSFTSRHRFVEAACEVRDACRRGVTCPATSHPSRSATSKASCRASTRRARRAARSPAAKAEPAGPDAIHLKAQDRSTAAGGKLADQEKFKREQHPFDAYDRLKEQAETNEPPKPRTISAGATTAVLRRARAELLHVPAAHPERHPEALAARRRRRSRGALRRALRACDDAREPADPRDRAEARGRGGRGHRGLGLWSRGAGADNIRNVTGTPTAGIDRRS